MSTARAGRAKLLPWAPSVLPAGLCAASSGAKPGHWKALLPSQVLAALPLR